MAEKNTNTEGQKAPSAQGQATLSQRGRMLGKRRALGVRLVTGVFALGALVGLLFFARPTVSELEKRELAHRPQLTVAGLVDGSCFEEFAAWYGDTYPLRDQLVAAGRSLQSLFGVSPSTQLVGGNVDADEVPDEGQRVDYANGVVMPPTDRAMAEGIKDHILQGLYVDDGAAYNIYYFNQEPVQLYADAINTCAKNVAGQAEVYSIVAPTSAAALLDEETLADLGGTDQNQAIHYFLSLYDEGVHGVNVYDTLREHNEEYLYFRTDQHWTQLGAYYAYLELCRARGIEPADILSHDSLTFEGFLGTYYAQLGLEEMQDNPDYIEAYLPATTNRLAAWDSEGEQVDASIIADASEWDASYKYGCFLSGDYPLSMIVNPSKHDGSTCLVVKDSYGCAIVPMILEDYQTTWVIDFRYSSRSIPEFVYENGVDDVIFVNSIVLAGTEPVASALMSQVQ